MNIFKSKPCKHLLLFLIGGTIYIFIEIIWRWLVGSSPAHWSMFILGGLSFLVIGEINEHLSWDTPFYIQCLIGTTGVLMLEFIFGCIVNLWLNLDVWDYSNQPLNILGQVCISFALLWFILTAVAIVIDDYIRYWLFDEEKPHYKFK